MYRNLDVRLEEVTELKRKKQKWMAHRQDLLEQLHASESKARHLKNVLDKEEEDVRKLEGVSLSNFFFTLLGRKTERLDKEMREMVEAKLKYDEAVQTVEDVKEELKKADQALQPLQQIEKEYQALLKEKERLIKDQNSVWTEELYRLVEQKASLRAEAKEYEEAWQAGEVASNRLQDVIEALEKAKSWSTFDLFGGGLISTMVKHDRINTAKGYIHSAQYALRNFESELKDIERQFHAPELEIGGFLTFADYFFDGLLADWTVHGRIRNSLEETQSCFRRVTSLNRNLKKRHEQLLREIEELKRRRIEIIKQAQ